MDSPIIDNERSDLPSAKRQKLEEEEEEEDEELKSSGDSDPNYDSDDIDEEELERFTEEYDKSGGFEMDFSKFRSTFDWHQLDLEDSQFAEEPETNKDFISMLANIALTKSNEGRESKLKLHDVLRANFHPATGFTFYISFQVVDPTDQIIPYQAVVGYLPGLIQVASCNPKSTTS